MAAARISACGSNMAFRRVRSHPPMAKKSVADSATPRPPEIRMGRALRTDDAVRDRSGAEPGMAEVSMTLGTTASSRSLAREGRNSEFAYFSTQHILLGDVKDSSAEGEDAVLADQIGDQRITKDPYTHLAPDYDAEIEGVLKDGYVLVTFPPESEKEESRDLLPDNGL